MDEILETSGQAILSCISAFTIIGIATFILFQVDSSTMTMGKYIFETLDSLLR